MSSQKITRLKAEMASAARNPSPGIHMFWEDPSKIDEIKVEISGPEDSPYAGGLFTLKIQIPEKYPFCPPSITFVTQIYHPNIDPNGRICLEALKTKPNGNWSVALNLITVLASIRVLLKEPNLSDPLMPEISQEYSQNHSKFIEKATKFTQLHAISGLKQF